mmetsp:Transcript_55870/g.133172  ORF Transcript_55870/g.133172 Transcript_55870/m.133172 type:complete len:117 (+) Transcript_55870:58-408(+)
MAAYLLAFRRAAGHPLLREQLLRPHGWSHCAGSSAEGAANSLRVDAPQLLQVRFRRDRGGRAKTKARRMLRQQKRKDSEDDFRARNAHNLPQEDITIRSAPPPPPPRVVPRGDPKL